MFRKLMISIFILTSSQGFATFGDVEDILRNPIFLEEVADYLVGDRWTKGPVEEVFFQANPSLEKLKAVSRIHSATSFYLGKKAGRHVYATNYHVCESKSICPPGTQITSPVINEPLILEQFIGSWSEIDIALFTVSMSHDQEVIMAKYALNFDFSFEQKPGTRLATAGYGFVANPLSKLTVTSDMDCVLYSDEVRLMGDPDVFNESDYNAWSFAHGCDVSHGDSGSPILEYGSGKVVGIVWTGRVPKIAEVQNTSYLKRVLNTGDEEIIWHHLNYGVPASKIKLVLEESTFDKDVQLLINDLLAVD